MTCVYNTGAYPLPCSCCGCSPPAGGFHRCHPCLPAWLLGHAGWLNIAVCNPQQQAFSITHRQFARCSMILAGHICTLHAHLQVLCMRGDRLER